MTYLLAAQHLRYALAARLFSDTTSGLLITDFDRSSYAAPLVYTARTFGWVTATTVHGSLNPPTYCPFRAEHVLVWGAAQAEVAEAHGACVHLVGRPDLLPLPEDRAPIRRVIICESGEHLSVNEQSRLIDLCEKATASGWERVVRRHPRYEALGDHPSWKVVSGHAQMSVATRSLVHDLRAGDLVVGIASTSLVEALMNGYRVLCLADGKRPLPADVQEIARNHPGSTTQVSLSAIQARIVCESGEGADRLLRAVMRRLS